MTIESGTASEGLSFGKKTERVIFQISLLSLHSEVRLWNRSFSGGGGRGSISVVGSKQNPRTTELEALQFSSQ